jgi:cytochrome b involved in lipid metabolism
MSLTVSLCFILPCVLGLTSCRPLPTLVRPGVQSLKTNYIHLQPRSDARFAYKSSALFASIVPFTNNTTCENDRFHRTATKDTLSDKLCILEIDNVSYNLTTWAKAHPGGLNVLRRHHDKDASKAFHAAGHSSHAYAMLKDFAIGPLDTSSRDSTGSNLVPSSTTAEATTNALTSITPTTCPHRPRWRQKLFTKEDPIGLHKYLGIFCLLHFTFRYAQMIFGDPSAGFGTRLGEGPSLWPAICLAPHALLSLSSLIFHTVPKERVVGKPMIWQEYRVHNIAFGLRSVICSFLAWLSIFHHHRAPWRRVAVVGSCLTALAANVVADEGTRRLRANSAESTTATMPYWEGCSAQTQKRFKLFYAYSQFMATLACIAVCNPIWGLAVLLAIQGASLLLTLVRKGLLSPRGYHIGYTFTLLVPYVVGFGSYKSMGPCKFPIMMAAGAGLFQLRRLGLNKYCLWLPIYAARMWFGDSWIPYTVW